MLVEMSREQAEKVLLSETNGRLSCDRGGRTYVVPVRYSYDGSELLVRTPVGQCPRLDDERVRFEVDHVQGVGRWQTVLAWGTCVREEPEAASRPQTAEHAALRIRVSSLRGFVHQKGSSNRIARVPA